MTVTTSDVDKLVNAGSILRIFWTPQHSHPLPYLPSRLLPYLPSRPVPSPWK